MPSRSAQLGAISTKLAVLSPKGLAASSFDRPRKLGVGAALGEVGQDLNVRPLHGLLFESGASYGRRCDEDLRALLDAAHGALQTGKQTAVHGAGGGETRPSRGRPQLVELFLELRCLALQLAEIERPRLAFDGVHVAKNFVDLADCQRAGCWTNDVEAALHTVLCSVHELHEDLASARDETAHRGHAARVLLLLGLNRSLQRLALADVGGQKHDAIDAAAFHHRSQLELQRSRADCVSLSATEVYLARRELGELGPLLERHVERHRKPLLERLGVEVVFAGTVQEIEVHGVPSRARLPEERAGELRRSAHDPAVASEGEDGLPHVVE